jgi:hypothetical protein
MQAVSSLRTAFGFGSENISDGRRRFVGLLSFVSFALILAATCSANWVVGSIDFQADSSNVNSPSTAHFRVDLANVIIEFVQPADSWSPDGITAFIEYPRRDWIARRIAAAAQPGCVIGKPQPQPSPPVVPTETNYWCSLPIQNFNRDIDATYGLLVFSCVLITIAWLMAWALMAGSTAFENPLSFKVLGGLLAGAAFFSIVGVITFAASKISTTFCQVFEGPVNESNDTILNCEQQRRRRARYPCALCTRPLPPPSHVSFCLFSQTAATTTGFSPQSPRRSSPASPRCSRGFGCLGRRRRRRRAPAARPPFRRQRARAALPTPTSAKTLASRSPPPALTPLE